MANVIGLTGQTGAGKSSVREILRKKGAAVIDADSVSHDITEKNTDCIYDIVCRFSCLVLNEKGSINRKALGKRVFSDKKSLPPLIKSFFRISWKLLSTKCSIASQKVQKQLLSTGQPSSKADAERCATRSFPLWQMKISAPNAS
ncbi:MAG: dephospho-CoA kinase [Oscillospiraceae bacterium]|nr:dephospho-CoA kinase [Oscillospiraceae bacterium]